MTTTTIGTLKTELKNFIDTLNETSQKLGAEIQKNNQEAEGIRKEYMATASTFAANTLTTLDGAAFDQISKLAQGIPQVTGQSLSYSRQEMIEQRKKALATINKGLKETVDITNFQTVINSAQDASKTAGTKAQEASSISTTADQALETWARSGEKELIGLDASLRAAGKQGINPDTKNYYDTESLFQAAWRFCTRDDSYRQVRRALVSYKQGFDGRDAFADIGTFQAKGVELKAAAEKAREERSEATNAYAELKQNSDALAEAGRNIRTDDQILEKLQEKLAGYLSTPEFMKAAADEYGEDFPSSLPLLAAKLKTLEQLRSDAEEKFKALVTDIQAAQTSYNKMRDADTSRSINVDIDQIRRDNENYTRGYNDYIGSASNSRTTTGTWSRSDSSDIYWKILLWNAVLSNNRQPNHGGVSVSLPSAPSLPSSSGNLSMNDIFKHAKAASSISMNDVFRNISNGTSRIDFSPPPPPPAPRRTSYSTTSFGGGSSTRRSGGGSFGSGSVTRRSGGGSFGGGGRRGGGSF